MTTPRQREANKRTFLVLLGLGVPLALGLAALLDRQPAHPTRPPEAKAVAAAPAIVVTPLPDPEPGLDTTAAPERAAPRPVIDEITVEKREVCEGEENLVTVKAHAGDGADADLRYSVAGIPGDRVPVRRFAPGATLNGRPPPRARVMVLSPNGSVAIAEVPAYTVKDCKEERSVAISAQLLANTWGRYGLEARIVEEGGAKERFQPVSFAWSFGDGVTVTTAQGFVEHDYEPRAQDAIDSRFLLSVEARDAAGRAVKGRSSLPMHNAAYEAFAKKGVVALLTSLEPRFPELGADGVVRQAVRLRHLRQVPARIERVEVTEVRADGSESTRASSPMSLGVDVVPPGDGVALSLTLDTRSHPDVEQLRFELEGTTDDGHPARGAFAVMRPPAPPTPETSQPVLDEKLIARITVAKSILHRPVTDGDLIELERRGAFAALGKPSGPYR
jgi:hypothetical protein